MELNLSNPNSQSFDEVLEKLKQSMKAARSGGWIDSDSGSELELAIDHPSPAPPPPPPTAAHHHPCTRGNGILMPRSTTTTANPTASETSDYVSALSLQIKDGRDLLLDHHHIAQVEDYNTKTRSDQLDLLPAPLLINTKSLVSNPRPTSTTDQPSNHPKTRPVKTWLNNYYHHHHHQPIEPCSISTTTNSLESRISPPFDPPTSPYASRTPSTPVSIGTSAGSPYVRHHFKWEYLAPSFTNREGILQPGPQPRIVESSSPPHSINPDESYTDWPRGFLPKEFIFSSDSSQATHEIDQPLEIFQRPSNLTAHFSAAASNGLRALSHSPVHCKSQSPARQALESGSSNNRIPGFEIRPAGMNSFKKSPGLEPLQKPWFPASASPLEPKQTNVLNPASVSSVSFSLAPAAPILLTAPERDPSQFRGSLVLDENSHSPTPGRINPIPDHFDTAHHRVRPQSSAVSASASSTSLRDLAQERDKEAIRARLMGSSSIDNLNTRLHHAHNNCRPFGTTTSLPDRGRLGQISGLPNLFQQMRFSHTTTATTSIHTTTHPAPPSQPRVNPFSDGSPLRSTSATYPVTPSFGAPVFYSSQAHHGTAINGHLHTPGPAIPYAPPTTVNKPPFVPVIVPTVPGMGGPVGTPLPGQVQPEEVRKSVKTQPPVVNTGNSGAMIPQPGDWMCICGFVNWRRRKVCMRCFPFADGNDSVGAMMAINAQRAALLAAGVPVTKDLPSSTSVISNSSPALFQPAETPSFQDPIGHTKDKHATLKQIFGPPESGFNYGRPSEPMAAFTSQPPQRISLNPFDKSSHLGPISPAAVIKQERSSDEIEHKKHYDGFTHYPSERADPTSNSGITRPAKNPKTLRARLIAPGEEERSDRNSWEEAMPKSPRPRSFSMGAKSVWESSVSSESVRGSETRMADDRTRLESIPIGKEEENGISGMEKNLGNQTVSNRLTPERHQEPNTISTNGPNFNRQRTTTSPTSSWQAIKALWQ